MTRIVIIGGGPAGYEAALVAASLGAQVTVVERDGVGGASVLTDCVPSKTFIASAGVMSSVRDSTGLGVRGSELATVGIDLAAVNQRVKGLAVAQSADVKARLVGEGVRVVAGQGRLSDERAAWSSTGSRCWTATARSPRRWSATSSSSPPAPTPACCPAPSPTTSGSSTGATSTTSRRCPSTWSSSAPA
jgi:pyruvate/2-oxoglutarate dehydrogenase complex dihydrolipoamide dehydrogenase (E3) component